MNKQILIIGFVSVLIIGTIGCISDRDKFIGEWKDQDGDIHHFFSDGTFNSYSGTQAQSGMWEIKDNKLVISRLTELTYSYSFSNNDKTLRLSGPQTLILTKKV